MRFIVENRKYILLIFVMFLCSSCVYNKEDSFDTEVINNKVQFINEITIYDDELEYEFVEYIYDVYGKDYLNDIISYVNDNGYEDSVWRKIIGKSLNVLFDYYNGDITNDNFKIVDTDEEATISFVGDVSLADDWEIIPRYDSRNQGVYGILSTDVVDIMKSSDVMVANNEFTVSNRGSRLPNKYYTFRAKPERLSIYGEMGVDIVSIANNHVYDYGEDAFLDMLNYLKEYDIPYVGGGINRKEAIKPYYFIVNGYKIAFIGATRAEKYILTPEATETTSGVFRAYDPTLLLDTISDVKKDSDYVILLIHWGTEDTYVLENVQVETGKQYIDAGADLIIGSHAHTLQGMEFYNGKLIAYNLGDFIFNRETKDTGILSVSIDNDGSFRYKFIPCKQDNFKTTLLDGSEKVRVINNMRNYSINTIFEDDGYFYSAS